jgi:hypothetical protein
MRLPSVTSSSALRAWLLGSVGLVLLVGCDNPVITDNSVTANSCVDGAHALRILVDAPTLVQKWMISASPNVVSSSIVDVSPTSFYVIAELDNVAAGEPVTIEVKTAVHTSNPSVSLSDIDFYTVPPPDLPPDPSCTTEALPNIDIANPPGGEVQVRIHDPLPGPLEIEQIDFAQTGVLLTPEALAWGDPQFEALDWQAGISGAVVLDPASGPLVISLGTSVTPGTIGVLCRFRSSANGQEVKGITQVELMNSALKAQSTTWGKVKSLYRN